MSTNNNNCNNKEDSIDDMTAAMGKLEGRGTGNTDNISDDVLLKQPPPEEDCPICLLRLPALESGSTYYPCCGKMICSGCNYAPVYDNLGNVIIKRKCSFCRTPVHKSKYTERLQKRVELDDAHAIVSLGCYYREGLYGSSQDYTRALKLFLRAGDLGHAKAYCNIGYSYENGRGVDIDKKKAMHYCELSAIRGNVVSRYNLGAIEENAGNMNRALKHYMISAGAGYDGSVKAIRQMFMDGHAMKGDYAKALQAYQAYLAEIKSAQRDKAAAAYANYRYY